MFLKSFEYFRGISILFIVAGHCFQLGNWEINNVFEKFIANIIAGGSSLFVFISGFLFHYVFFKKYKYVRFIFKKIRNVLIPYLVLSVLPIVYFVFIMYSILVNIQANPRSSCLTFKTAPFCPIFLATIRNNYCCYTSL